MSRRRGHRWAGATAAPLLVMGLAGCAGAESEGALRVALWAGGYELEVEQQVIDAYRDANPGVRVVLESAPTGYEERLLTSIASGHPPDVYLMDAPDIPTFVDRGLAVDIAPYLDELGFASDQVFPQVLEAFQRADALYAFPKDFTPMVIYVNRSVVRDAGAQGPDGPGWTFDEFTQAARRATRDADGDGQPEVYGFDFPRNLYQWVPFVWSAGGDILTDGGRRATGAMDAAPALAAYRFLTALVEEGVTPGAQFLQQGDPAREARFASGGQAFLLSGHWTLRVFRDMVDDGALDLTVAPIPHGPGQDRATSVLYASGWAVPPNVRNRRRAIHLAAFLSSPVAQRIRAGSGLAISSRIDVAREIAATDSTGIEARFLELVEGSRMTWGARVRDFRRVEALAVEIMDRALLLGDSLPMAAAEVAREVDAQLGGSTP